MPKIRRHNLPEPVLRHLLLRIREREISSSQLQLLSEWIDQAPEVPVGMWFRRFPGMIVCGEGDLIKTFLLPLQSPIGKELI